MTRPLEPEATRASPPPIMSATGSSGEGPVSVERELMRQLRQQINHDVVEMSSMESLRANPFDTLLQAGTDVHGSHGLFYWLRARGRGAIVRSDRAGLVLSWRPDVGRLTAIRPVGETDAIVDLLSSIGKATSNKWPHTPLIARYCGTEVAERLVERGWAAPSSPWLADAPLDDETYPEVVITADAVDLPKGQRYNLIRKALHLHTGLYSHRVAQSPLNCGETEFVTSQNARVDHYDAQEKGFNDTLLTALTPHQPDGTKYHYLFQESTLCGFAITANTTGIAHIYYMGTTKTSRLSAFFQWLIYLEERRSGATALNLGGSESESLHIFKTRTFRDHLLQRSFMLQYPRSG